MTSRQQKSYQPGKGHGVSADRLVALPSLSCALSSLPQAKSMDSVSLHQSMYAQRAAQSEAKLQKVLTKTASSYSPQTPSMPIYMNPPPRDTSSPGSTSPPLMMRKPERSKLHA